MNCKRQFTVILIQMIKIGLYYHFEKTKSVYSSFVNFWTWNIHVWLMDSEDFLVHSLDKNVNLLCHLPAYLFLYCLPWKYI